MPPRTPKKILHSIEECPQAPVLESQFSNIHDTLNVIKEDHKEMKENQMRFTVALEKIVEQGVMVKDMKEDIGKFAHDLGEAFGRLRKLEDTKNIEAGRRQVQMANARFWDKIKINMSPWFARILIIFLYLEFRMDISSKIWKILFKTFFE